MSGSPSLSRPKLTQQPKVGNVRRLSGLHVVDVSDSGEEDSADTPPPSQPGVVVPAVPPLPISAVKVTAPRFSPIFFLGPPLAVALRSTHVRPPL